MIFTDLFESRDMCHVCGQTPCNCTHIAESAGNVGDTIRSLYQQFYDQGDDALEYLNTHAENFARYWDRFEGDLDSMIEELPPKILARLAQELQTVAAQEGLEEEKVRLDPKCWSGKKIGSPKTKIKGGVRVNNCVPAESIEENYDNGEYSDEAGMAHGNLITIARAARGLLDTIDQHEDLPEWVQEKIAKVEGMLVSAWNYLQSQEAQGIDPRVSEMYANLAENWQRVSHRLELNQEFDMIESIVESIARRNGVDAETVWADLESLTEDELYVFAVTSEPIMEDWQKANKRDKTDGMSRKAVKAYRREHPGSKLQTAVTTKPSKLKKGSKASKRRKSYCSRSRGQMKMHNISCAKTPDKAICKARRRWNCEGVDRSDQTVVAEGSGYDGSGPLDLSKNPSVNDVFKRALYIHDYEGYGNNMDYSEDEAIDQYVERKFGQDVLNQLNKARYHSYFGREGGNKGGHIRSSNLGRASAPVGKFRTTKAGKMHGQDAKIMKGKVADRLGRHPAPTLPEGDMYGDEEVSWEKGGRRAPTGAFRNPALGTPVVSLSDFGDKDNTKDKYGRTVPRKLKKDDPRVRFHKDYSQHEKKLIGKMSNAEKADKGWRNPNIDEVSDETLINYMTKVAADSQKHPKDPTKRSPEKANRSVSGFARAFNKLDARKEKTDEVKQKAVPSSQRDPGALATRSHIASQEKAHSDWAARQKALADEFYKNHPELDDRPKPIEENSMADELARMAMKRNPNALVRVDGKTLQSPPPGPKPAGTTAPRPAPKFDPEAEYSDDYSVWHRRTKGLSEGSSIAEAWARRYPNLNSDIAECKSTGDSERLQRLMAIKNIIDSDSGVGQ